MPTAEALAGTAGADAPAARLVLLRFSDGESRQVEVGPDQTVLAAAKQAGLRLASQCEVGTCCTCVARLTSGAATMPAGLVTALTRDEIAAGQRLLCQTRVAGEARPDVEPDVEFDVEYPSSLLAANPPVAFTAKISRVTWVAESVVQLGLKVPKSSRFRFTAGQYCRLKVPGTDEWRSYSMASGEHEQGRLTFLVRVLPSGAMSDFLRHGARAGVAVEMEGPLGGFVLDPSERPHLLVAGGTGLAPMLSMLDRIRLVRPTPPVLLVFGCVRENDLFLLDELEARRSFMPTLTTRVSLEEPVDRPGIVTGNPVSALAPEDIRPGAVAYLCGPPGMIAAAQRRLKDLGLDEHDIRSEQFLPS